MKQNNVVKPQVKGVSKKRDVKKLASSLRLNLIRRKKAKNNLNGANK
jgi:hypothetical protein